MFEAQGSIKKGRSGRKYKADAVNLFEEPVISIFSVEEF
jgi:hypothetical protein